MTGVTTPDAAGCFGPEAATAVTSTIGSSVWLQEDPTGDGYLVWYWNANLGGLRLLNSELIAAGNAGYNDDQGGVLGSWLDEVEATAEDDGLGLWAVCRGADGRWINPPTPTPTPAPTDAELRADYQWIDVRDLLIRPGEFEGEKIAISGTVFNIQVEDGLTAMQIWVDGGNYDAVMIGYYGDSMGIYEGTWITVYGVGSGTFTGTNAYGGTIVQPLIIATYVDH